MCVHDRSGVSGLQKPKRWALELFVVYNGRAWEAAKRPAENLPSCRRTK